MKILILVFLPKIIFFRYTKLNTILLHLQTKQVFMILNSISIDCVIFGFDKSGLRVLLSKVNKNELMQSLPKLASEDQIRELFDKHPILLEDYYWNLFGAHVPEDQDLDEYAKDLLFQATGLHNVYLKQFHAFGDCKRVNYIRVITIGYYALINPDFHDLKRSNLAESLNWFYLDELPPLPFDHKKIIKTALNKLRQEVMYHPVGFHLLPDKFTLTEIQSLYEIILNKKMDTRNFRKKLAKMKLLIDTNEKQINVAHRAAKLYMFDIKVYDKLIKEGLNFRIT